MTVELRSGQHAFETDKTIIAYYVRGKGSPCFVAPYAWGMNSEPIRYFFKTLEKHLTLVYHDPPGTGRSGPPKHDTDLGMSRVVADMFSLQSRLGLHKITLMGHSGGAACALSYALRYPRRVTNLILIGAGAVYPELLWSKEVGEALAISLKERDEKHFRQLQAKFLGPEIKTRKAKLTMGRAMKFSIHFNIDRTVHNFMELSNWDVRGELGNVEARTLIMVGKYDKLTPPKFARELHKGIKGSKYVSFAKSGHFPFLDEPEKFQKSILEFLK